MLGDRLPAHVKMFGNGIWGHCTQCNNANNSSSCGVSDGLENISSHWVNDFL
jgi:hypothetical protein